jgi:hypothetical protein
MLFNSTLILYNVPTFGTTNFSIRKKRSFGRTNHLHFKGSIENENIRLCTQTALFLATKADNPDTQTARQSHKSHKPQKMGRITHKHTDREQGDLIKYSRSSGKN